MIFYYLLKQIDNLSRIHFGAASYDCDISLIESHRNQCIKQLQINAGNTVDLIDNNNNNNDQWI